MLSDKKRGQLLPGSQILRGAGGILLMRSGNWGSYSMAQKQMQEIKKRHQTKRPRVSRFKKPPKSHRRGWRLVARGGSLNLKFVLNGSKKRKKRFFFLFIFTSC